MVLIISHEDEDPILDKIRIRLASRLEPKGTKRKLEEIFEGIDIPEKLKSVYQKKLDDAVKRRGLTRDHNMNQYFVLSKDDEGSYSWEPATRRDIIMNYVVNKL